MAEGKKGFLLYADLIHTVAKLPDDIAGRLFKTLLDYVNDKDPEPDELIIQVLFEPIKRQLKRDLEKWEETKQKDSLNGRVGNLKRWATDLYNQYIEGKITLEQAEQIASDRKASPPDKKASPRVGKIAVTVTDTVTDIDIKNNKVVNLILPFQSDNFKTAWELLLKEKKWRNKSPRALEMSLKKLTGRDESEAIGMIEAAIAGEWQGFVEPKKQYNGTNKNINGKPTVKTEDEKSSTAFGDFGGKAHRFGP